MSIDLIFGLPGTVERNWDAEVEAALEAGCEGFISKPINVRLLPEQVRSCLEARSGSVSGGEQEQDPDRR